MSAKGTRTTTNPIPKQYIKKIEKLLSENKRNYCLFTLGIQTGLRIGSILSLKVGQVRYLEVGDVIQIKESKTKKTNELGINQKSFDAIQSYLADVELDDNDYLFKSRKGDKALSVASTSTLVKEWCRLVGLTGKHGNFAAHSLRKTYGLALRQANVPIEMISMRFNHASLKTTERYIGLTSTEVKDMLMIEV